MIRGVSNKQIKLICLCSHVQQKIGFTIKLHLNVIDY